MPRVIFKYSDRGSLECEVRPGETVLDAALDNAAPGIIGQCGGAAPCLTCHCHVISWQGQLPAVEALEAEVLEYVYGQANDSRLACQIRVDATLSEIVVRPASRQI